MSQQLTVELTEREMDHVRAAAQAKHLDPKHMTGHQLLELLAAVNDAAVSVNSASNHAANISTLSALDIKRVANITADQKLVVRLKTPKPALTAGEARAKRLAAAMSVNGMWQGQTDKPQDGLEYQREVRTEWQ